MNFLDKLAEDNSHLIKGQTFDDDDNILSKTIDEPLIPVNKTAAISPLFERICQGFDDLDCHQNDETKDFWQVKQGKIIRVVSSKLVKG